jgi:hypothetical protein
MARIIYRDEEVDVEYNLYGAYIPATYENPEEYPDVIITQVYYKEIDILPLLNYEDQEEISENLIEYLYG